MTKSKPPENIVIEYTDWSRFLPWLTQLAFVLAISLVTARAIMLETLRETFSEILGNSLAPRACGAAGSVVLDLACCVPALLILLRRALDKSYIVRFTWAQALLAIFAAWAMLSTIWAGDKFESLVLAFHLVAAAALFWAMAQLVRSWVRLRLVAGLCLGVLLIYIAHGITYRFYDVPETVRYWEEHRAEEMQAHDWHEGDFSLQQYELKLKNGEMVGFDASPNSFAATIVLLGVIVAGAGVQRIVNRDGVGWIVATFLPLPLAAWMLWFARSKGALFTPILAAGILLVIAKFGKMLNRDSTELVEVKRKVTFFACGFACVLAVIAVIGHGVFHGSLPTDSLNFRWRYWVASMHLFAAHPILGVGYGNFSYGYLAYRLPAAAEEIQDPHNMLVRAMTELGIIGLVLMIAWLVRVWWEWTWPTMPAATVSKSAEQKNGPRTMLITILSLSILGMLVRILAGTDLSANENWVTLELITHLGYGLLAFVGYAIVVIFSMKDSSLDNRFAPWILYGMLASLAVFLIHNMIDFAIFEVGPMMLFALVGGAVLGARSPSAAGMQKRNRAAKISLAVAAVAWLIAVIFVATPLVQAENRAAQGDDALRKHDFRLAAEHYQAAYMQAPVHNADYALRAAQALVAVPNEDGLVRADLGNAIAASPLDPLGYLTRARYNLQAHANQQPDIRHDFETALALNPNDIDTRLEYARVLESWKDFGAAAEQYRAALKINDGYDLTEPKRLPDAQVKDIQDRVERLSK